MTTETKDWGLDEDAADNAVETVNAPLAPVTAAPIAPTKPAMMDSGGVLLPVPAIPPQPTVAAPAQVTAPDFSSVSDAELAGLQKELLGRRQPFSPRENAIRSELFKRQQGLPVIAPDLNEFNRQKAKSLANATQSRIDDHAKFSAALAADNFDRMTLIPTRPIDPIITRLFAETKFRVAVAIARKAGCAQMILHIENFSASSPVKRIEELKRLIFSTRDLDTLHALKDEALMLNSPHAKIVARSIRAALFEEYDKNLKPYLAQLLELAISFIESYKTSAVQQEQAFFKQNNVAYESTGVSRKYDAVLSELRRRKDLTNHQQPAVPMIGDGHFPPVPTDTLLAHVFGLSLVEPIAS